MMVGSVIILKKRTDPDSNFKKGSDPDLDIPIQSHYKYKIYYKYLSSKIIIVLIS